MEVERKFLVSEAPPLGGESASEIQQGYLAAGERGEVRLRRRGHERTLTVKRGSGLSREEEELELDEEGFDRLWPLTQGQRLRKRRYTIDQGEHCIEVDVYEGALDGLTLAEVEFPSEDAARAFEPPDWFGEEVTGDDSYLNETLAVEGVPAR
jgi:adenylate cyclase